MGNWALGEWLINYEGGFVRRGLLGQIFQIFDNPGRIIHFFQKAIIFLFFISILIYLFLEKKKAYYYNLLSLSYFVLGVLLIF